MKKILLVSLAAAAFGLTPSAFAQTAGPVGAVPKTPVAAPKKAKIGHKEMEQINEDVLAKMNLTDDQKAKIKAHKDETAAKEQELKQARKAAKKAGTTNADVEEKRKALKKEDKAFMKQILTKQQMKAMGKMRRDEIKAYETKTAPTVAKP